ncbi:LuxR C-terminal-related transcriptional regulator [Couchioplanes caeruleus]|uniref:LuxR C-terminal-related transcriptional regulator n=1 Tax=Couchioplanes caeruleus TaxID=56438 RepID=UPI0024681B35|nr:LuxR C-terminal-related transcriptional regulator [Couchioplanes caeruleus]
MSQQDLAGLAAAHLRRPGLVVLTGVPGAGRSTLLRRVAQAAAGPVHAGGGLAMLAGVPALALSRAVKARLPAHDVPLLAEAVRSRVRTGLLVLDDLQYADPATLAALPHLATRIRVVAALRTPHRIPEATVAALRGAATAWLDIAPLDPPAAADLVRRTAGHLDGAAVAAVVARAGGNPLAITALARAAGAGRGTPDTDIDQVAYAIATALADLPRAARTALAALGLLGRPAPPALLGAGAQALHEAGLVHDTGDGIVAVSAYVAEIAAGLLDADARTELHRALATAVPDAEAARHLAAAGDHPQAYRKALAAADHTTGGDRADLLLFACACPGVTVTARVRVAAADALLAAGRPHAAAAVLATPGPLGVEADVLRGEALLQAGDPVAARAAVAPVPDAAAATVVAARDRVLLLADLACDPVTAADTAEKIIARHPTPPPGVAAALAAVRAAHRTPGWERELAAAASAATDPLTARWSAWLLVGHLIADGRLADAARSARSAAAACGAALAYSWQTRFLAVAGWAEVLQGHTLPPSAADLVATAPTSVADDVVRKGADLADRALPPDARAYALAATALVEADTGLLAAARARLATPQEHPATAWVAREAAWLDGQPERAAAPAEACTAGLLTGLQHITSRWAAYDTGGRSRTPAGDAAPAIPAGLPDAARRTLTAWATGTGFTAAAQAWAGTARREQIRCLLAAGLQEADPDRAVAALLEAEHLADEAGLVVLAGRARRGLRRHRVHRDTRSPRSGTNLTRRELDVLHLVAAGEPTRRIAGQLGIAAETVDTHIRAGMRKLGARTRTEAAALALTQLESGRFHPPPAGRDHPGSPDRSPPPERGAPRDRSDRSDRSDREDGR